MAPERPGAVARAEAYWEAGGQSVGGQVPWKREVASRFLPDSGRVLDVGCGKGQSSLRGWIGVDADSRALHHARERGLQVVVADVESHLPFPDASFDAVVFFDVLEHLANPLFPLAEAARILEPNGRLLVTLPNGVHLVNRLTGLFGGTSDFTDAAHRLGLPISDHLHRFSLSSAHRLLTGAGFRVIERTDYFPDRFDEGKWVHLSPLARALSESGLVKRLPSLVAYEFAFVCRRA